MGAASSRRFDGLVRAWLDTFQSANTRAAYRRDLERFAEWSRTAAERPLGVDAADIGRFRLSCEAAGDSPATVARRMSSVSSFFSFVGVTHQSRHEPNPVHAAHRPASVVESSTQQLTREQAATVWSAAQRLSSKSAVLVALVLFDGLKTSEILLLDCADIGSGQGTGRVTVQRRGRLARVAIGARTVAALTRQRAGRTDGPLLVGDTPMRASTRLSRFGADYLIKRVGVAAGLDAPLTANILRRTHIAHAYADGRGMEDLSDAVGHANARTTRRYVPGYRPAGRQGYVGE